MQTLQPVVELELATMILYELLFQRGLEKFPNLPHLLYIPTY